MQAGVQRLVRDPQSVYRATPALHQLDCEGRRFFLDRRRQWRPKRAFVHAARRNSDELAVIVCNFTPVVRHDYRIGVPRPGRYVERINTDAEDYGGSGIGNAGAVLAEPHPMHGHAYSLRLQLPPLRRDDLHRRAIGVARFVDVVHPDER